LAAVVDALAAQEDQLVERMLARMRDEVPESFFSDPAVYQAGVDSIYQNLRTILVALRSGREVPEPPSGAIAEARVDAQSGSPLDGLIQSYRIGHSVIWEAAMDEMDAWIPDVAMRGRVLRLVSRFLFAYIDRVVPPIVDAYEQERDAQFRDREQRKRRLVRDLIAGLPIDTRARAKDGSEFDGLDGLRDYLLAKKKDVIVRLFCRRLLGYALGRSVALSDTALLDAMAAELEGGRGVAAAVEAVVRSPQFRTVRGSEYEE